MDVEVKLEVWLVSLEALLEPQTNGEVFPALHAEVVVVIDCVYLLSGVTE